MIPSYPSNTHFVRNRDCKRRNQDLISFDQRKPFSQENLPSGMWQRKILPYQVTRGQGPMEMFAIGLFFSYNKEFTFPHKSSQACKHSKVHTCANSLHEVIKSRMEHELGILGGYLAIFVDQNKIQRNTKYLRAHINPWMHTP